MVEISIICLIYKSPKLADMVYESIKKYTPMLETGEAEFFFVANDPTESLVNHLENKGYSYFVKNNKKLTDKELFKQGYAKPEYIRRVYEGYNYGITIAKGKRVVLINSDNFFSEDWLENLIKYSEYKNIVCSTLVEPGHPEHGVFPGAIEQNFGNTVETFKENDFQKFANKIRKTGIKRDGAYMPCLFYKDVAIQAGLYPLGNIAGEDFETVKQYGDMNFYEKLSSFGIEHFSALDSIVYHLKEGEKDEKNKDNKIYIEKKGQIEITNPFSIKSKNLVVYLKPSETHDEIIKKFLNKVSVIIYDYETKEELVHQIKMFENQSFKNIEFLICKKNFEIEEKENVIVIDNINIDISDQIYQCIDKSCGEYFIFPKKEYEYESNFIDSLLNGPNRTLLASTLQIMENNKNIGISINRSIGTALFKKHDLLNNIISLIVCVRTNNFYYSEELKIDEKDTFISDKKIVKVSSFNSNKLGLNVLYNSVIKKSMKKIKKLAEVTKKNGIKYTTTKIINRIKK
ncbi:MAG: hypothetical protein RR500_06800 [Bacilli bacterium]